MTKPKLKRHFWWKMVLTNCVFLVFVVAVFTVIRYRTSVAATRNAVEDVLIQYADTNTSQLQLMFDDMAEVTLNIAISDLTINILKKANNYGGSNNYFEVSQAERRQLMNMMQQTVGIRIAGSSIGIVSNMGDYVLLDIYPFPFFDRSKMRSLSMLEFWGNTESYKVISPAQTDSYGRTDLSLFSYARKISDGYHTLGYVEFQKPVSDLETIFSRASENFHLISFILHEDQVFYLSDPDLSLQEIRPEEWNRTWKKGAVSTVQLGQNSYLAYHTSVPDYGFDIYTLFPRSYYTRQVWGEAGLLIAQSILLLLSLMLLILLITKQIYRPVLELRHKIENLDPEHIKPEPDLPRNADELQLFNHVFAEMVERIQRQKDELLMQKIRELQVSYRALQAQVSPHFLYNTLYLIGLKGEEHDAPEILDMCYCLTHMLGYCVDMKNDFVPFSRELEYTNNYLQLMKYRYLDKLRYEIDVAEDVTKILVPRFILQPLVENCFTHGFKNCDAESFLIHISLKTAGDAWHLAIEDNGNGFSPQDQARVRKDIEFVRQSVETPNAKFVNGITGIGLVNTFARLLISCSGDVALHIGAGDLQGSLVEITCPISCHKVEALSGEMT